MDLCGKDAVQRWFTFLVDNVDPRYIIADIYRRKGMSRELMRNMHHDDVRSHRAEVFFLEIVDTCPFHVLINVLRNTKHTFVALKLLRTYKDLTDNCVTSKPESKHGHGDFNMQGQTQTLVISEERGRKCFTIPENITYKIDLSGSSCEALEDELRSYRDDGAIHTMEGRINKLLLEWESDYKYRPPSTDRAHMAELVLEAKLTWLRFLVEAEKYCDILAQIHDIGSLILHTSHPCLSTLLIVAVQAQLLIPLRLHMDDILRKFELMKPTASSIGCAMQVAVHVQVAEFFVIYLSFEQTGQKEKKFAAQIYLDEMISKFSHSQCISTTIREYVSKFVRRALVVKALLCVGMTTKGSSNPGSVVEEEDLASARDALQKVEEDWNYMNVKWKMLYYVAQSKLLLLQSNAQRALVQVEYANVLSRQLYQCEEIRNTDCLMNEIKSSLNC